MWQIFPREGWKRKSFFEVYHRKKDCSEQPDSSAAQRNWWHAQHENHSFFATCFLKNRYAWKTASVANNSGMTCDMRYFEKKLLVLLI